MIKQIIDHVRANRIYIPVTIIAVIVVSGSLLQGSPNTNPPKVSPSPTEYVAKTVKVQISPTIAIPASTNTPAPTVPTDPYTVLSKLGKDEAGGEASTVTIAKNEDGSIDVYNNITLVPEMDSESTMDLYTRRWVTKFIRGAYQTGLNIRYVLVTVSIIGTDRPATRVGMGVKRVEADTFEGLGSTMLCYLINRVPQVGDNVAPDNPNYDPSDWIFAKNCKD